MRVIPLDSADAVVLFLETQTSKGTHMENQKLTEAIRYRDIICGGSESMKFLALPPRNLASSNPKVYHPRKFYGLVEDLFEQLCNVNDQGYSIFVLPNKPLDSCSRKEGYKDRDIVETRGWLLFDADDEDISVVVGRCPKDWVSMVVLSSEKDGVPRGHGYIKVNGNVPVEMFKPLQSSIARKLGTDRMVCNPATQIRMPGFRHPKRGNIVEIVYENIKPVPLARIIEVFKPGPVQHRDAEDGCSAFLTWPKMIPEGHRHNELFQWLIHCRRFGIDTDGLKKLGTWYIQRYSSDGTYGDDGDTGEIIDKMLEWVPDNVMTRDWPSWYEQEANNSVKEWLKCL